jgi:hypothetical protein
MSVNDEIQNLILNVRGQDELARLNQQLDSESRILNQLAADFRQGNISQAQFDAGAQAMAGSIVGLNHQIAELDSRARGMGSPQGLLNLSYIFDDLANTTGGWERKLASISNNIPALLMSLGKDGLQGKIAALAGPIGLVATALIALAPLAKAAWDSMSSDKPKEVLDEIAAAAKRVKDELDKLRGSESPEAAETRKGFEDLFAGRGKEIQGSIANALTATGRGEHMTPAEAAAAGQTDAEIDAAVDADIRAQGAAGKAWAAAEKTQRKAIRDRQRSAAIERINKANVEEAGKLLGRAPNEIGARQTILALAQATPGNFSAGFAGDMRSMEADAIAARDAEAAAFEESNERYRELKRHRRDAAKKRAEENRKIDALNRQGEQGDEALARDADRERRQDLRAGQQAQRDLNRDAAIRQRRGPVDDFARRMWDFNQQNRAGLSDDQIQSAAAQAVQMVRAGANVNDALMSAFMGQMQQMQALQQRLQMQAARARGLMMGSDFSGNFSQIPPGLGY